MDVCYLSRTWHAVGIINLSALYYLHGVHIAFQAVSNQNRISSEHIKQLVLNFPYWRRNVPQTFLRYTAESVPSRKRMWANWDSEFKNFRRPYLRRQKSNQIFESLCTPGSCFFCLLYWFETNFRYFVISVHWKSLISWLFSELLGFSLVLRELMRRFEKNQTWYKSLSMNMYIFFFIIDP